MPSIMYKLLVNPPAHKGPKMVARPPTERLTPWLNPFGDTSQRIEGYSFTIWPDNNVFFFARHVPRCNGEITCQPCVFSAVTLEKRDT